MGAFLFSDLAPRGPRINAVPWKLDAREKRDEAAQKDSALRLSRVGSRDEQGTGYKSNAQDHPPERELFYLLKGEDTKQWTSQQSRYTQAKVK
jgi:hypothetical protein